MTAAVTSIEARLASLESSLGISSSAGPPKNDDSVVSSSTSKDALSRIALIMSKMHETAQRQPSAGTTRTSATARPPSSSQTLDDDWKTIDRLTAELDAGPVLSHQGTAGLSSSTAAAQPLSAPLLYRRQEVLASAEALAAGMEQLGRVRDLVLSTSAAAGPKNTSLQVASATGGKAGSKAPPGRKGGPPHGQESAGNGQAGAERFVDAPLLTSERYEYATDPVARRRLHDVAVRVGDVNARAVDVATRVDNLVARYHRIMSIVSEKLVLADEELAVLEQKKAAA